MFKNVLFLLLVFTIPAYSFGQGCSDAGFCTVNVFKPEMEDTLPAAKNQIKIGIFNGAAEHNISVFGSYLEYNRQINHKISTDVKLTSLSQTGNNISTFGFSDVFLNLNYLPSKKLRLTMGVKIPLNEGNTMKDGFHLPMDYQSSLGTVDIIAGIGYKLKKVDFVLAVQQPLTHNKNQFITELFPPENILSTFHSTNNYKRNGDILIRISYPLSFGNNFKLTPGLLPIYHLNNDKFTDLNGVEKEIKGSQGLTLNGNIYLDYMIKDLNFVQLSFGAPILVRDARPDGLTRSYVVNLEYRFGF